MKFIVACGFILLVVISIAFQYYYSFKMQNNEQYAKLDVAAEKLNTYLSEYNRKALGVANVAGALWEFKQNNSNNNSNDSLLAAYLYNSATYFPEAVGIGLWYEAYKFNPDKMYCGPYVYWQKDSLILTWDMSSENYNYFNKAWYTTTLPLGWDRRLRRPNKTYWSDAYYDSLLRQKVIPVCAPIYNYEDNILGVACVSLGLEKFSKYINKTDAGENYKSVVISLRDDIFLANSVEPNLVGKTAEYQKWYKSIRDSVNKLKPIELSFVLNGINYNGYFKKLTDNVMYGIFVDEISIEASTLYDTLGLVSVYIFLFFGLLYFVKTENKKKAKESDRQIALLSVYQKYYNALPEACCVVDSYGKVLEYNKSFADVFVLSNKETSELMLKQLIGSSEDYSSIIDVFTTLEPGGSILLEKKCKKSDDIEFLGEIKIAIADDVQEKKYIIFISDITAQTRHNKDILSINESLNESVEKYKAKLLEKEHEIHLLKLNREELQKELLDLETELDNMQNQLSDETAKVSLLKEDIANKESQILASEKAKNKYLGVIAHDLKTPVNTIHHASEAWLRSLESFDLEMSNEFCNTIYKSSMFLSEILDDLLIWNRNQTGCINCAPMFESMASIVEDVIDLQSSLAENKNIRVVNAIDKNVKVFIDIIMTRTIILNLLANAIKYSEREAEIIIGYNGDNGKGFKTFYVKDNGIGMDTLVMDNIFKNDILYSQKGTENELGTGFGLFITKEFIEKQGGRIWAVSTPGKGSIFYFTLPDSEPLA